MDVVLERIVEEVRLAVADHRRLRIRAGGSKDFFGESSEGEILDLAPLAGVIEYEPSELVLTAYAGTRLTDIDALLARHGQFVAFEPPAFGGSPTLGGIVAAGLAGPRRASAGAVRDFVLGARLLSGQGELLSFGGRVMKNVAGFDVARLLAGSLGILGVITELSLKVLPRPALERTLSFELGMEAAIMALNRHARAPVPLSATSWHDGIAHLRLSGAETAVDAASAALGGETLDVSTASAWWAALRDHTHPWLAPRTPLWRISVPATAPALDVPGTQLVEWAGALRWLRSTAPASAVRAAARRAGGSAALWHGDGVEPMFDTLPEPMLRIQRRLKERFDPAGVFNHGRLIRGL